jgi:hypothetical protein
MCSFMAKYSETSEVGHPYNSDTSHSWLLFHGTGKIILIYTWSNLYNLATPTSCNLSTFRISHYTFQSVYFGIGNFSCTSLYISNPTHLPPLPASNNLPQRCIGNRIFVSGLCLLYAHSCYCICLLHVLNFHLGCRLVL